MPALSMSAAEAAPLDLSPRDEAEAAEIVAAARARAEPLTIVGGGTRTALGRPAAPASPRLSTARLTGIVLYEPAELLIGARAGTPLAEIEAALSARGQYLPFEPMDHRRLLGSTGEPTIGAVAACNVSGPRRLLAGAARDHLIGLRLVNGRGEVVKSGGRVMKNVTGLDLAKLSCGAMGTLGLLTEVTFKVLPAPEYTATLEIPGLDDAAALAAMAAALGTPFEVSGAAHLPAAASGGEARTLLRIEGFEAPVKARLRRLAERLGTGSGHLLEGPESARSWRDIADVAPLGGPDGREVWRLHLPGPRAGAVCAAVRRIAGSSHFLDWGGGLLWAAVPPVPAAAAILREAAGAAGGFATLVRAEPARRRTEPLFEPLSAPLRRLTAGIKASFDPDGILNAGRMYEGI